MAMKFSEGMYWRRVRETRRKGPIRSILCGWDTERDRKYSSECYMYLVEEEVYGTVDDASREAEGTGERIALGP